MSELSTTPVESTPTPLNPSLAAEDFTGVADLITQLSEQRDKAIENQRLINYSMINYLTTGTYTLPTLK